jgi:hypothetical protein
MKYKCFPGVQMFAREHLWYSNFVNWRSGVTGLHKVREYTHFVCINQLEDSLVWVRRGMCILY